ncbi:MAG: HPF/RaiA family ribosome-associated protein [Spirochaetia bacterium]
MQIPLELQFKKIKRIPELEDYIRLRVDKLDHFCDHISSCRIIVDKPQEHLDSGSPYRVRIDVTVPPGHELVSRREPGNGEMHEELKTVIADTFNGMERQLKKLNQQQRGEVKEHPQQQVTGIVRKIFPEEGYGIIESIEGRDVYFHRNSVLHGDFERIEIGTGVNFMQELGDEGLQASTVRVVDKPGVRGAKTEES